MSGTPSWSADKKAAPSPYVNAAETGNYTYTSTAAVDTSHPSVPAGTPASLFQTERYDVAAAPQLQWDFPAPAGKRYEVRLFFAEIFSGTSAVGARTFDVVLDGNVVLDDYDTFAKVGANKGVVERVQVTSDANIDIDFVHVANNPAIKAIEIVELPASSPGQLGASPSSLGFGKVLVNTTANQTLSLTNLGTTGSPSITITSTSITGTNPGQFSDSFVDGTGVTVAPGATHSVTVSFKPTSTGLKGATLNVAHNGSNSPVSVPLSGEGVSSVPISFSKGTLTGETSNQPTTLQFGPDGRLYVGQQNGLIKIYTVVRNGKDSYAVTATESITSIMSLPNHNDDGSLNTNVKNRQMTGLLVVGTAANPMIYVGSSDPRIGGGSSGADKGLDTNSGIISRLTWNGSSWQKLDLVRGLPRSEENHAINGLQLDAATNTLFVAQGGNTNQGAPSNNFANLPEYALSAAVLSVDLDAIGNTTYDLPTLDDSDRAGTVDANDPFGGNNAKNQAKLVPGGPVQVHHAGFRNPYDIVITESGRQYTIDNGGNAGWGEVPVGEGPQGTCTNGLNEPGKTTIDTLHLVTAGGYGGHPNPTRANTANTFSSPPQSPVSVGNPVECDWRAPGAERGNITSYPESTNGLTEYTADNFGGQMKGDLLTAAFDNKIYRTKLNSAGTALASNQALFQSVGSTPLDVTAQDDGDIFPGTIWVADIGNGNIAVFEPGDYAGGGTGGCSGADSTTLDEDADGFTNADEIDNGTNPCSSADVPLDRDGDKISDLNDPDDDNDGLPDTSDAFAVDAANGTTTTTPLQLTWDNDAQASEGLMGLGFTGLMTNGVSNYQALFDPSKMTAGGAAGVTTVDQVSEGDAYATTNSQEYGFQVGVVPPSGPFTAHTRILAPFAGVTPQNYQSMGLFIGTGHQDHYAKLVVSANGGTGGIQFLKEVNGSPVARPTATVTLPGPSAIDLYLTINPATGTVQPSYTVTDGITTGPRTNLGGPEPIPASWYSGPAAMAAGIISTSAGPAPAFAATWDFLEVVEEAATSTALTASPTSVALTGTQSGASASADVTISSTDGSAASIGATDNTSWLSVSPSTGTTPETLSVTANPSGLAAGTYNGTVTVTATGYTSVQVPVTFTVNPEIERGLQANPSTVNLSTPQGNTTTSADVSLSSTDGSAGSFTVSDNAQWLSVSPTTGTTPKSVAVTANASGLAPGTYNATVTAQASGYTTVQIPVQLTVNPTTYWSTMTPMPVPLGEVSSGIIGNTLYVVGQGSRVTLAYDLDAKTWTSSGLAVRPFVGNHHAAEVVDNKLYLFGGLGNSSDGKVQIYDPASNSWTLGADMPFAAGSSSTALIGGDVYVAGGITGTTTTNQAARYDPPSNTWQSIAPMPQGRNHAAAETDGSKMYVFGGRGPGSGDSNVVANGFDTVQVYNPANNTWVSSLDAGSTLKPLPQGRGGMGTAIYYQGELYVIGGETKTGPGANASGVYGRVDIYKPTTNTWRLGPNMPTARHGIFPVLDGNVIHVPGGGVQAGASTSGVYEVLTASK